MQEIEAIEALEGVVVADVNPEIRVVDAAINGALFEEDVAEDAASVPVAQPEVISPLAVDLTPQEESVHFQAEAADELNQKPEEEEEQEEEEGDELQQRWYGNALFDICQVFSTLQIEAEKLDFRRYLTLPVEEVMAIARRGARWHWTAAARARDYRQYELIRMALNLRGERFYEKAVRTMWLPSIWQRHPNALGIGFLLGAVAVPTMFSPFNKVPSWVYQVTGCVIGGIFVSIHRGGLSK